ncbi:MAG: hypothetical protein K6F34_08725 [Lachnospiraceae bacterium]|nr:hypothetical protein [Lachnospiraceae bacterium]
MIRELFEDKKRLLKFLLLGPVIVSLVIGIVGGILKPETILYIFIVCMALIYPVELLIVNIVAFIRAVRHPEKLLPGTDEAKLYGIMDVFTFVAGVMLSLLYAMLVEVMGVEWDAVWSKELINDEIHQPVWSGAVPTVITLVVIGVAGYAILQSRKISKTPPLVTVLCMGAIYIGLSQMVLFSIQMLKITPFEGLVYRHEYFRGLFFLPLMELPFCCVTMSARLIMRKIYEWNQDKEHNAESFAGKGPLAGLNRLLGNAASWPVVAVIAMIPVLGVVLGVLTLFGQSPDHVIRAWTETAQWNLSMMKAPPNVQYDEHYLCTVAAGGHEKVVKPLRMGERHGHRIVVNRQLLIANAFEQILEEKTPRFHRAVRNFYDTHGYPIARHIKTKFAADIVYFIMKPLEWIFLIVLYLTDAKPENRIATQYMPR